MSEALERQIEQLEQQLAAAEARVEQLEQQLVAAEARIEALLKELKHVSRSAVYDDLTGLLRRGFFLEELERSLSHMEGGRKRTPQLRVASVIFLDIDDFKLTNDNYSHPVGDLVLEAVARAVKSLLRRGDLVCRWGGEEIVVFLPGASKFDAAERAESIRQGIAGITFEEHPDLHVTASFGVAMTTAIIPAPVDILIRCADRAMYQAKAAGKNQVRVDESL